VNTGAASRRASATRLGAGRGQSEARPARRSASENAARAGAGEHQSASRRASASRLAAGRGQSEARPARRSASLNEVRAGAGVHPYGLEARQPSVAHGRTESRHARHAAPEIAVCAGARESLVRLKLHRLPGPLRLGPGRQPCHFLAQEPESAAGECGRRQGGSGPGAGLDPGPRRATDRARDLASTGRAVRVSEQRRRTGPPRSAGWTVLKWQVWGHGRSPARLSGRQ